MVPQLILMAASRMNGQEKGTAAKIVDPDSHRIAISAGIFLSLLGLALSYFAVPFFDQQFQNRLTIVARTLPEHVVGDTRAYAWESYGNAQADIADLVPGVRAPDESEVTRIKVPYTAQNVYDFAAVGRILRPLATGDQLVFKIWLRLAPDHANPAQSSAHLRLQKHSSGYDLIGERDVVLTGQWQSFEVSGVVPRDFKPGETDFVVQIGKGPHVVDFSHGEVVRVAKAEK